MKDFKPVFKELEKNLAKQKWFDESWTIYNRGVYMQVAKENWFNDDQGGIHFETYVEKYELESKIVPIHMHVEDDFPEAAKFIPLFVERARDTIGAWKGYKVHGAGYLVCQRKLQLDPGSLAAHLLEEFSRLQQLAPLIDRTIEDVLSAA